MEACSPCARPPVLVGGLCCLLYVYPLGHCVPANLKDPCNFTKLNAKDSARCVRAVRVSPTVLCVLWTILDKKFWRLWRPKWWIFSRQGPTPPPPPPSSPPPLYFVPGLPPCACLMSSSQNINPTDKLENELQCLLEARRFCCITKLQSGVLCNFFQVFYELEIVTEDTYYLWRERDARRCDDLALNEVQSFLSFLENGDAELGEEEEAQMEAMS